MLLTLALIVLALLLARALYATPTRWDAPQYTGNQRQHLPGTRVRANHLHRVLDARAAVRGDTGYVHLIPTSSE